MPNEKDITEKTLESHNDVFADIINVLVFNGKEVVKEDELQDSLPRSQIKDDGGQIHEQERDVAKFWRSQKIRIALLGFENQTKVDRDMPLRVISYDGAAYKEQVNQHIAAEQKRGDGKPKEKRLPVYPAITLVLYFGKKHWKGPTSLLECIKTEIPDELKPYVNDYKIMVKEISFLTPNQVKMFKSDFRVVADYFVQTRTNKEYQPSEDTIHHVDAVLKLMSALTRDNRYESAISEIESQKGEHNMCQVLDAVQKQGEIKGEIKGKIVGEHIALFTLVNNKKISVEDAAEVLGITPAEFEKRLADYKAKQNSDQPAK